MLGQARLSGDPVAIAKAEAAHDEYVALCKRPGVKMQMDLPPFPRV